MANIIGFVKKNWLVVILVLVMVFLLLRNNTGMVSTSRGESFGGVADLSITPAAMTKSISSGIYMPYNQAAPTAQTDRIVVQNTSMSMLVRDVAVTLKGIEKEAVGAGGYMVNKSISQPEGAASGYISLRVPTEKREETLDGIRALGVKVISENVVGTDVTDQYVDLAGRIASLEKTKARIKAILDQATSVNDLMNVQMQLTNIEQQIDSYKGQQNYLSQTAKLTMISVNLSTDELSLPYAPDKAWRPAVVFKNAVRSLVSTVRDIGSLLIWVVVYAPVWGLALGAIYLYKKMKAKKSTV
jgi:hypothetical protein